ncbi:MAG: cation:proton antiporter [Chloroflexaceae bacterium]|nr:cation:proton antiporter [Chloroflexaceae bacterium]
MGSVAIEEGQIIIGAAVLDDILGIVILAVVVALVETGSVNVSNILVLILNAVVFVGGSLLLSKYFAPRFDALIDRLKVPGGLLYISVIFLFLLSWTAAALGLEAVLGAFAAGLILSGSKRQQEINRQVQPLVTLFATIFFVKIGTGIDLSILNPFNPANYSGLAIALFLIAVAIAGKLVTGFAVSGPEKLNPLAIGVGMIPRGEVGLVFVGLGTATGVLTKSVEAALILMVIATTLLAPILLRLVFNSTNVIKSEGKEVVTGEE